MNELGQIIYFDIICYKLILLNGYELIIKQITVS